MTWFMIDDGIYDAPQCEELPLSAMGLWTMAGSYVGRQLRHGDYDGAITMQRGIRSRCRFQAVRG